MLEYYEIENIEQLRVIADMLRLRIFEMLQKKPMTATQLVSRSFRLVCFAERNLYSATRIK